LIKVAYKGGFYYYPDAWRQATEQLHLWTVTNAETVFFYCRSFGRPRRAVSKCH